MTEAVGAWVLSQRAEQLNDLRRHQQAAEVAHQGLVDHPDDVGLHLQLAVARGGLEDPWGMLESARAAGALRPMDPRPCYLSSLALIDLSRTTEAVDAARRGIELAPQAAISHRLLSQALVRDRPRDPEATAAARRALAIDSSDPENHTALSMALHESGRWWNRAARTRAARPHLDQALQLSPHDTMALNERARQEIRRNPIRAAATLSGAVHVDPHDPVLRHNMDVALSNMVVMAHWVLFVISFFARGSAAGSQGVSLALAGIAIGALLLIVVRLHRAVPKVWVFLRGFPRRRPLIAAWSACLVLVAAAYLAAALADTPDARAASVRLAFLPLLAGAVLSWISHFREKRRP